MAARTASPSAARTHNMQTVRTMRARAPIAIAARYSLRTRASIFMRCRRLRGRDYPRVVSLRRFSPYRGRRLRVDEALFERMAMTRAGSYLGQKLAPHVDTFLIPRTNGHL